MNAPAVPSRDIERRSIVVTGLVQGVGFRPFVHRLAEELGLAGFVLNQSGEVHVEAEGTRGVLQHFEHALLRRAPPRAEISDLQSKVIAPDGSRGFSIVESRHDCRSASTPVVAPDIASCESCLRELLAPNDRRFRYAFANCADCGPRFTIIQGLPYDRARTTMRGFQLCAACRLEYEQPSDRRFHAQPAAPSSSSSMNLEGRSTRGIHCWLQPKPFWLSKSSPSRASEAFISPAWPAANVPPESFGAKKGVMTSRSRCSSASCRGRSSCVSSTRSPGRCSPAPRAQSCSGGAGTR